MTAVDPSLGSARPALLEREKELAAAAALLEDIRAERGRLLLVEAPAG